MCFLAYLITKSFEIQLLIFFITIPWNPYYGLPDMKFYHL